MRKHSIFAVGFGLLSAFVLTQCGLDSKLDTPSRTKQSCADMSPEECQAAEAEAAAEAERAAEEQARAEEGDPTQGDPESSDLTTIYVTAAATDDSGDGSIDQPKKTIQEAINIAKAGIGVSVYIAEGTYLEHVVLKEGVSLFGGYSATDWGMRDTSANKSIVRDPRVAGGNNYTAPISTIEVSNIPTAITIEGLWVYAANVEKVLAVGNSAAIFLDNSKAVLVRDNRLFGGETGAAEAGITLKNSDGFIFSNVISGGGLASGSTRAEYTFGIHILFNSSPQIANNQVNGGFGSAASYGLKDWGYGNVYATGNAFNGGSGAQTFGVAFSNIVGTKNFLNNTVFGGDSSYSSGMEISSGSGSTGRINVRNNTISGGDGGVGSGIDVAGIKLTGYVHQLVEISNNIIFTEASSGNRICVSEETDNATPLSLRNNNFFGCPTALFKNFQSGNLTAIFPIESLNDMTAVGNESMSVTFTAGYRLSITAHPNITQGGLDGNVQGWGFGNDKDGSVRTTAKPGNPNNIGAAGWSMGAFELN
jgi:hypothetical protein